MRARAHDPKVDALLALPMQVWAWAFFILPTFRLLVFRLTEFAIPVSAQLAAVTLASLGYLLISRPAFAIPKSAPIGMLLLLTAFATYVAIGSSSNATGTLLATAWIYFVAPCCAILIGIINADKVNARAPANASKTVDRCLAVSTVCVLIGISINAVDLTVLGDAYPTVYESFGTTAAATFAGLSLPRLAGAYFSGLDLTYAVVLLFVIQASRGRRFAWAPQLILYVAVLLTFTRNAYVILLMSTLISRFSKINISRFAATVYLLSPLLSIAVMASLALQATSGQLEPSAETSSLLTRLSAWLTISDTIIGNPISGILGLGLTQNALIPGESDIYAIDNFFWELICYAGVIAFIAYGVLFRNVRLQAVRKESAVSKIALSLTALIPVAGIFNNMAGTMFTFVLFLCYGLLGGLRSHAPESGPVQSSNQTMPPRSATSA